MDIVDVMDAFAERVAAKLAERLAPAPPARIALADVRNHGAPSARWVQAKAREGAIEIKGPRGGRFVDAEALATLIASASIKRRIRPEPSGSADVSAVVDQLATRRAARERKKTA